MTPLPPLLRYQVDKNGIPRVNLVVNVEVIAAPDNDHEPELDTGGGIKSRAVGVIERNTGGAKIPLLRAGRKT